MTPGFGKDAHTTGYVRENPTRKALTKMRTFTQAVVALALLAAGLFGLLEDGPARVLADEGASPVSPVQSPERSAAQRRNTRDALATPPGALGARGGAARFALLNGGRFDPCRPVEFVYNPVGAPEGAVRDLRDALHRMSTATGLDLVLDGPTNAADQDWAVTGGARRPVLVNWGRPGHGVLMEGASATAEPVGYDNAAGRTVFVSGQLTFNVEHDHIYRPGFGTYGSRVSLYMHEIGHVLGLDHVDDNRQLMFGTVANARDLGAGDLAGLRVLTGGGCLADPR